MTNNNDEDVPETTGDPLADETRAICEAMSGISLALRMWPHDRSAAPLARALRSRADTIERIQERKAATACGEGTP